MFQASTSLLMIASVTSRRVVSNGSPHLSVAYDLSCFRKVFKRYKLWPYLGAEVDGDSHYGITTGFGSGLS